MKDDGSKALAAEVITKITARKEIRMDVSGLMIDTSEEFKENFSNELLTKGHFMNIEEGHYFVSISFREIGGDYAWWQLHR